MNSVKNMYSKILRQLLRLFSNDITNAMPCKSNKATFCV